MAFPAIDILTAILSAALAGVKWQAAKENRRAEAEMERCLRELEALREGRDEPDE